LAGSEAALARRAGGHKAKNDLSPRVRPTQQRAKETVEQILDNAACLLDEVGVDAFNTNLLAERANVAVRSVYRYYPNKLAVIVGLAERQAREWQQIFADLLVPMADPGLDAFEAWDDVLDGYVGYIEGRQGRSAIHRAMQALPQLAEVNRRDNDALADAIAAALRARGADERPSRIALIARTLLDTQDVAVDEALSRRGRVPVQLLDELKLMHRSYLAHFVS
jgi:AcrR family transcriptional regulator